MELKLPLNALICHPCAEEHGRAIPVLQPDAVMAEIVVPRSDGTARKVPIHVMRMTFEDAGDGRARGHVRARVPCLDCSGAHEVDVSDIYRAPELHLTGAARCACGRSMKFERKASWDYVDEGEHGGVIELTAVLTCDECHTRADETLRFAAPDMARAQAAGSVALDIAAAERKPQAGS
jgi:hypothetical protein